MARRRFYHARNALSIPKCKLVKVFLEWRLCRVRHTRLEGEICTKPVVEPFKAIGGCILRLSAKVKCKSDPSPHQSAKVKCKNDVYALRRVYFSFHVILTHLRGFVKNFMQIFVYFDNSHEVGVVSRPAPRSSSALIYDKLVKIYLDMIIHF